MNYHELFYYKNNVLYWKEREVTGRGANLSAKVFNQPVGYKHSGARSKTTYLRARLGLKQVMVHRIIWEMHYGPTPGGFVIDHVDGNGLNNSLDNLRLVSRIENARNYPRQSNNTSGVVGVSKDGNKWRAAIGGGKKREDLGAFEDLFEAVCARKSAENNLGYHPNHGRSE